MEISFTKLCTTKLCFPQNCTFEICTSKVHITEIYPSSLIFFSPFIPHIDTLLQDRKLFFIRHPSTPAQ